MRVRKFSKRAGSSRASKMYFCGTFPDGPMFSPVLATELFKLSRRLPLLFWGFAFVPICSFAADIFILSNPIHLPDMAPRIDMLLLLSHALEIGSSPLAQFF